jgi:Ca2+-binding RTX toxin-like protein
MATINGNNSSNALNGTSFADVIRGFGGNDILRGFGGNDLLDGGLGSDRMIGGTGNDTYVVNSSLDRVFENFGQGTDTVRSFLNFSLASNFENLALFGSATFGNGNGLNNSITGNGANNTLRGFGGSDRLSGLGGNDLLLGGTGNDLVTGGVGNDRLFGDQGNDRLFGGDGADRLFGGSGNDVLFGGAGQDQFHFLVGSGRDEIRDFVDDVDTIYIDRDFGFSSVQEVLENASSSGGDSAIDLSKNGDDAPRIIIFGLDNFNKLANDIVLI